MRRYNRRDERGGAGGSGRGEVGVCGGFEIDCTVPGSDQQRRRVIRRDRTSEGKVDRGERRM